MVLRDVLFDVKPLINGNGTHQSAERVVWFLKFEVSDNKQPSDNSVLSMAVDVDTDLVAEATNDIEGPNA